MDYTPNSHKFKEEQKATTQTAAPAEKKVSKVVKGNVKIKKKSEARKFADIFLPEDVSNVKSFIVQDVLIPALKKVISDTVDTFLYGGSRRGNSTSNAGKVSYSSYYGGDRFSSRDDRPPFDTRKGFDLGDVILDTRQEANDVLNRMEELIDSYRKVSVGDLYDLLGKSCDYTANNYGWTSVRAAEVIRVRDGYLIKFPKPMPID